MGFLYFLYKNHKYLFFYIYSKTPKGKTYILSKKTKAIENIKNNVFKTKWKRDFNEISDYGLPILQIKVIYGTFRFLNRFTIYFCINFIHWFNILIE